MMLKGTNRCCLLALLIWSIGGSQPLLAEDRDLQETLQRMELLLQQQQEELKAQRKELAEQRALIEQLQKAQEPPLNREVRAPEHLAEQEEPGGLPASDTLVNADPDSGREENVSGLAKMEQEVEAETQTETETSAWLYDPSNTVYDEDFLGAWQLPGTSAAMRIGGYVNVALVNSFDPVLIPDRFITGSIPPEGKDVPGAKAGTEVTVNQTRVNIEVRQQAAGGMLRAFIEGDFASDGDEFRLRHAFGQYRTVLAGKTSTTLMDINSSPEQVDFEGINGQILLRQPQLRFSPGFGQNMSFRLALENPQTDVINGTGVRGHADLIMSMDRLPLGTLGSWNSRVGLIYRDLQAQDVTDGSGVPGDEFLSSGATGWGVTTSGRKSLTWWGEEDFVLWQLTYGEGIGRYINDLGTIGGGDAVFDPEGKLHALPVFAGYFSYQHRWSKDFWFMDEVPGQMRSNFTVSWVNINNFDFQDGLNYGSTFRASANVIYQPAQKVTLGMELLWGERTNKDHSKGTAGQLQVSARYDF